MSNQQQPTPTTGPSGPSSCLSRREVITAAGAATLLALPRIGHARWKPAKPVQIILGFTAGGVPDLVSRRLAEHFSSEFGVPFVVVNRPGASGQIANNLLLQAPADGHSMTVCFFGPSGLLPAYNNADPTDNGSRGFASAGVICSASMVVVSPADKGWKNMADLREGLRKLPPGSGSFGSPGNATVLRLYGELIADSLGVSMQHIGYKGMPPVLNDLMVGSLHFAPSTLPPAVTLIQAGRLNALALSSGGAEVPALAGVKTLTEQGLSNIDRTAWYGVWLKDGTPDFILQELNQSIRRFMKNAAFLKTLQDNGLAPMPQVAPAEVIPLLNRDISAWKDVVRRLGLKLEG